MDANSQPQTLLEAMRYFSDPDVCLDFVARLRWPNGVACPTCGSLDIRFLATRRVWECKSKHPRKQFSVKVGTIFKDSPIGLDKWLAAIWMVANDKNGISSYEIARGIGVTQKSAWFMLHRIRLAMQTGTFQKLSGDVEVDETFLGGKAKNMHKEVRERKIHGRGPSGKIIVMGILERHGRTHLAVVPNRDTTTLQTKVREHIAPGATVYTDELASYAGLDLDYLHEVINHAESYAQGAVHTNGMENFWSLLGRTIDGTYVSVEPFHLTRYLDEQAYRFDHRKENDGERFEGTLEGIVGRRLTFDQLTGKVESSDVFVPER